MSDSRTKQAVQQIVRRESRSLLHYLIDAYPWTTAGRADHADALHAMILAERDVLSRLARWMSRNRIPLPAGGAFPTDFTSMNFLGLEHVAEVLLGLQKQAVESLQAALPQITDPEAREAVEALLTLKKKHVADLQSLSAPAAAVMS